MLVPQRKTINPKNRRWRVSLTLDEPKAKKSRMALNTITLISLLFILGIYGSALSEELTDAALVKLEKIQGLYHKDYSSIVLQFDRGVSFEAPIVEGNAVFFQFNNFVTDLASYHEFKALDSWVALEKMGKGLHVRMGLPNDFNELKYYRFDSPYRLFVQLYKDKKIPSPAGENEHRVLAKTTLPPRVKSDGPVVEISANDSKSDLVENKKPTVPEKRNKHKFNSTNPKPITREKDVSPGPTKNNKIAEKSDRSMNKPIEDKSERKDLFRPNGLMTVNFYQSDIQEILSALAMEREINIATSRDVTGKVSVHLHQVALDEALDAITLAGGFRYHKYDDLYYIYKPKETRDPQKKKTQMKILRLKYAETDKIQEILGGLADIDTVQVHKPSKTIIVEDTAENIQKIETIISHWDRAPKQVLIEAKILEVNLTDDMQFGVDWSKILGDLNISTSGFSRSTLPTSEAVNPVPSEGSGIFSNLITAIGSNYQFATALDALQNKTKVNTLSTPKVFAIHGKLAKVQVGGQQGYRVTTTNLGVATETIEFIDTGTILEITPYIDDDGNILLQVLPSITDAKLDQGIPVTKTTSVSTWLLAKDGQTVFIGGLIQDKKEKMRDMIPCLGSINGIGALFGRTTTSLEKVELIFLITPRIFDGMPTDEDLKAIDKTRKLEEMFRKEPLPPDKQILDFISPVK